MPATETMVIMTLFLSFAFIFYTFIQARHKERMTLIETGQSADLFIKKERIRYFTALKWGIILLFLGCSLAIGIHIDINYNNGINGPVATFPIMLVGGGLGFLVYYIIAKKQDIQ